MLLSFFYIGCVGVLQISTLFLSYSIGFNWERKHRMSLISLVIAIICVFLNASIYLVSHRMVIGRWNFLITMFQIYHKEFSYQDMIKEATILLICLVGAFLVGALCNYMRIVTEGNVCKKLYIQRIVSLILGSFIVFWIVIFYNTGFSAYKKMAFNEIQPITNNEEYNAYIELYNVGMFPNAIQNLFITDDLEQFDKIAVPDTVVGKYGFLVVDIDEEILRLKKSGEQTLYLTDFEGNVIDQIQTEAVDKGHVYARLEDGMDMWDTNQEMSPGKSNQNALMVLSNPVFSRKAGFYDAPFYLELSSESNGEIYYTLDGSIPTKNAMEYKEPIYVYDKTCEPNVFRNQKRVVKDYDNQFSEPENVDKAFIIRAVCIDANGNSSEVVNATYFIDKFEYQKSSVISVIADPDDLYGPDGIYVVGSDYDEWYHAENQGEEPLANYSQQGRQYEIEGSLSLFTDKLEFEQPVGLRIAGGSSRVLPVKAFSFYARDEYSGSSVFSEEIFQGIKSHKIGTRGGYINSIAQRLGESTRIPVQQLFRTSIFVNGEFLANTNIIEKYGARYFQQHYNVAMDNLILFIGFELKDGNEGDWGEKEELYNFIREHDLSDMENYDIFCQMVDIDNYIEYMAFRIYLDDMDFTEEKNAVMWKARDITTNPYEDGRWRWALYDLDAMELDDAEEFGYTSQAQKNTFVLSTDATDYLAIDEQEIFHALMRNPVFRERFVQTFLDFTNTIFTPINVSKCIAEYGEDVRDYQESNTTTQSIEYYSEFFEERPRYILNYLAEEFNLQGTLSKLNIHVNEDGCGHFQLNTSGMVATTEAGCWTGCYYTDYPIQIKAVPDKGYRFVRWEGADDSLDDTICLTLSKGENDIYAVFEKE